VHLPSLLADQTRVLTFEPIGNLENAVLDLERKRITQEEGKKAQSAMAALDVGQSKTQSVKSEDVDFIVSQANKGEGVNLADIHWGCRPRKSAVASRKPRPR
jgi:hypothetical protein